MDGPHLDGPQPSRTFQSSSQRILLFVSPDCFFTFSYSVAQSDTLSGICNIGEGSLTVLSHIKPLHALGLSGSGRLMAHLAESSGGDGRGFHTWRGPEDIYGHRQGLCSSSGRMEGYSVLSFRKLVFIKPEMVFSFVDLFALAWLLVC